MDGMDACIAGSATEARPRQMRPREVRNVKFKITCTGVYMCCITNGYAPALFNSSHIPAP